MEKDVTALGLLRRRAGSGQERASDTEESENNVVLERKVEELEEIHETAFRKLIASLWSSQGVCGFSSMPASGARNNYP